MRIIITCYLLYFYRIKLQVFIFSYDKYCIFSKLLTWIKKDNNKNNNKKMKIAQHEILTIMQSWNSATLKATMLKSLTSLVYKEWL